VKWPSVFVALTVNHRVVRLRESREVRRQGHDRPVRLVHRDREIDRVPRVKVERNRRRHDRERVSAVTVAPAVAVYPVSSSIVKVIV